MDLLDGERDFLDAVLAHPDDDGTRLVYADWLEEQGDDARAEWLRTEVDLRRIRRRATRDDQFVHDIALVTDVLRSTSEGIDGAWLRNLARVPVENCREGDRWPSFRFVCDKQWSDLRPTDEDDVRACDRCRRHVFYCRTADEARRHAAAGRCVAMAVLPSREPDVVGETVPAEDFLGEMIDDLS